MSIIKTEHLTHIYSQGTPYERAALQDFNIEIEEGEFAGIIGHTGSGKSTLIQHLNGLLKPDSGKILIDGEDITSGNVSLRRIRQKVGLVFQYPEYQLFEETVEKDVAFGPKNLGISPEETVMRVKDALRLTGLDYDEIAERSPFELSGGQKRRVAIAGVLAMQPKILILDEPAAGLDPGSHDRILAMIQEIRRERKSTVILVSHNMDDAAEMCDRIFAMKDGEILLSGTQEEIFSAADILRDAGLGLPAAADLIRRMRDMGADIDADGILLPEQAADAVAGWLKGKERRGKKC